ncbi:RNA polymerase sigma-70 factor [Flavobacterium reichenbachii]|uniref:RNA polymerase subunit sigma-24 n=1 Tax=Flavobacterium reichenbachii TaxID=362418 RepID=A0A085ZG96_9FLAO|nr:RNA polymerase sigma-70 factor [Flavobacterium reichenbachii]KFF03460.1 RNA polymerase subunit sigma-24 [Flavobacterium reichenbachii]OXB15719.1 RNA polymerase sigma-70 factor [Flavobacterium reichenbachii]
MMNPEIFNQTYTNYWKKLNAFSYTMTQDKDLAQNIVQDVFVDLWERKEELNINAIEPYLFRAVKNQVFKHYQNNRFDKTILEDKFEDYIIDHFSSIDPELMDILYTLLDKLPEKRKEVLLMYKFQDMSIDQIAEELGISKQTVKNQISAALKQLREGLKDLTWLLPYVIFYHNF